MAVYAIAIFAVFGFICLTQRKTFWETRVSLKLPVVFFIFYSIFSIPIILNLNDNIHGFYGMIYGLFNFPIIYLFDVDKIELYIFGKAGLETSKLTYAIISILFWFFISFFIGIAIDIKNNKK